MNRTTLSRASILSVTVGAVLTLLTRPGLPAGAQESGAAVEIPGTDPFQARGPTAKDFQCGNTDEILMVRIFITPNQTTPTEELGRSIRKLDPCMVCVDPLSKQRVILLEASIPQEELCQRARADKSFQSVHLVSRSPDTKNWSACLDLQRASLGSATLFELRPDRQATESEVQEVLKHFPGKVTKEGDRYILDVERGSEIETFVKVGAGRKMHVDPQYLLDELYRP